VVGGWNHPSERILFVPNVIIVEGGAAVLVVLCSIDLTTSTHAIHIQMHIQKEIEKEFVVERPSACASSHHRWCFQFVRARERTIFQLRQESLQ
jgi:hypothetical protein